jgi:TM2 domain-containing membrane protein YozV
MSEQEAIQEEKYTSIAYLLWGLGFVGICGLHRMYLGQYGLGTAMLLTFGFCGVGQVIEVATIPQATQDANARNGYQKNSVDQEVNAPREQQAVEARAVSAKVDELDELDLEQASIEETMKKLRKY